MRARRERADDLQAPLVAVGEAGAALVAEAREVEDFQKFETEVAVVALVAREARRAQHRVQQVLLRVAVAGGHHVFEHRHAGEEPYVLERARDAADAEEGGRHRPDDACRRLGSGRVSGSAMPSARG